MELRLGSLVELERWVLGWGAQAEVLNPPELRASLKQTVRDISARYT
ncbi:MAG: WYL domain-containing protein [Candidatus Synoicihabitans palmerolidicus]|nr:WYL domain-containing protein [Candidatus Synoicihabitans palmerolidicus]